MTYSIMAPHLKPLALLIITCYIALAYANPLQDFCIATKNSSVNVNGLTCEDPKLAQPDDFFFSGLDIAGNTTNEYGSKVTKVFVTQLPALNTLGISMARLDIAPGGINPLHIHPRATEVLTLIEGSIEVGFITSSPENKLITKILKKGDVFVFPKGLIHYEFNGGNCNAFAKVFLSSQDPGFVLIGDSLFGSNPSISSDLLEKSFHVDESIIFNLKTKFETVNPQH